VSVWWLAERVARLPDGRVRCVGAGGGGLGGGGVIGIPGGGGCFGGWVFCWGGVGGRRGIDGGVAGFSGGGGGGGGLWGCFVEGGLEEPCGLVGGVLAVAGCVRGGGGGGVGGGGGGGGGGLGVVGLRVTGGGAHRPSGWREEGGMGLWLC